MANLILVKPSEKYIGEIHDFRQELIDHSSPFDGCGGLENYEDIGAWVTLCRLTEKEETKPNPDWVEAETFMLMAEGERHILGMINFRHYLNDYLAEYGGHIGYAIRPTERRKGYAKTMLSLCLTECKKIGLSSVLLTCDPENEGSYRTIEACGGQFERITELEGKNFSRYWITLDHIVNYYSNYDEEGRLDATKSGQVEFLTTMRYIERYLKPDYEVLDIGAGTGRYSRAIADFELNHYKKCNVEAVELVPHNIEIFSKAIKPEQHISITQGNALDLSMFEDNRFDMTLLMGPMYHLYTDEDKQRAIAEAIRVTKPGGVIFVAYCISDATLLLEGFQQNNLNISDYIRRGKIDANTFDTYSKSEDIFELVRKQDIDRLMKAHNVERLHYVATDMMTHFIRDAVNEMDDEAFALYMRYHYAVCEMYDMVGLTHHSLDIFRKLGD